MEYPYCLETVKSQPETTKTGFLHFYFFFRSLMNKITIHFLLLSFAIKNSLIESYMPDLHDLT